MNIEHTNKIFADYMNLQKYSKKEYLRNGIIWNENELRYHSSWDWLMPVVQEIERSVLIDEFKIEAGTVTIRASSDSRPSLSQNLHYNVIDTTRKMECIYNACFLFITYRDSISY